jgi:mannitol-1-phosphate 5-dehydrogenase
LIQNLENQGKVIVFGAGATGRGHVGLLCWQKGYRLVFVDSNPILVQALREGGDYRVRLFSGNQSSNGYEEIKVTGYKVYESSERAEIANEIVTADLVLTAVFDQNLHDVAETLAMAVRLCRHLNREKPIHVIACENMMDSSSTLGQYVEQLIEEKDLDYFKKKFAFPDCMISRVVPRPDADPLCIITEDYNEWTIRKDALIDKLPAGMDFIEPVENQTARLERKLFIHNGGHAVCGYVGFHRRCRYIHQAVHDPIVARFVSGALDELGEVIRHKHGFSKAEIEVYKADLGRRGSIAALEDDVLRVVRDPIRKLSCRERLVAPALFAGEAGLSRKWIVRGIVCVLKYSHPSDPQSIELQKMLNQGGLAATLQEISALQPGSVLPGEIEAAWLHWDEIFS